MSKLFFPGKERSRIAFFWLCYFVIIALCVLAFAQFFPKRWWWYSWGISASVAAFILTRYFVTKETGKNKSDYLETDRYTLLRLFLGIVAGIIIIAVIVWILLPVLHLKIERNGTSLTDVIFWNLALIPCAFHEELGFRGYTLKKLNKNLSPWKSQSIIAVLFAVYHIIGGQDMMSALFSTSLWSVIFALSASYSKGLALSTGVHAGANIGQAIFGLKLNQGFPACYTLSGTGATVAHQGLMVLLVQASVLIVVIGSLIFFHHLINKKPRHHEESI